MPGDTAAAACTMQTLLTDAALAVVATISEGVALTAAVKVRDPRRGVQDNLRTCPVLFVERSLAVKWVGQGTKKS